MKPGTVSVSTVLCEKTMASKVSMPRSTPARTSFVPVDYDQRMAFVRFTVSAPKISAAQFSGSIGAFANAASDAVRGVAAQLPVPDGTVLQELAIFDDLDTQEFDHVAPVRVIKDGAAAGNVTVTGINPDTDELESVWKVHNIATDAGPPTITDLTAQFTITAANTINNTAGTTSAGDCLLVTYIRHS